MAASYIGTFPGKIQLEGIIVKTGKVDKCKKLPILDKVAQASYTPVEWIRDLISCKEMMGPRLQPGQRSVISCHDWGDDIFDGQKGQVRH
jgi:hypothetical protein